MYSCWLPCALFNSLTSRSEAIQPSVCVHVCASIHLQLVVVPALPLESHWSYAGSKRGKDHSELGSWTLHFLPHSVWCTLQTPDLQETGKVHSLSSAQLVCLERWSCSRGASCVVEDTMWGVRTWSLRTLPFLATKSAVLSTMSGHCQEDKPCTGRVEWGATSIKVIPEVHAISYIYKHYSDQPEWTVKGEKHIRYPCSGKPQVIDQMWSK